MPLPTLEELRDRFWRTYKDAEWKPKTDVIPGDELREWMKSNDLEVLGFLNSLIHNHRFRIEPPIDLADYIAFVKHYYGRCLRVNPDGEWCKGRYPAGWDIVKIFCSLWDEKEQPTKVIAGLKKWLAEIYRKGDSDVRLCLETATLEHLFERKAIRKFFSDWKKDAVLLQAYENAMLWAKGGKSPLSRRR